MLGREVATLVDAKMKAGTHNVEWNASGSPSGVYFYQLTAGKFSEVRKLIVMK